MLSRLVHLRLTQALALEGMELSSYLEELWNHLMWSGLRFQYIQTWKHIFVKSTGRPSMQCRVFYIHLRQTNSWPRIVQTSNTCQRLRTSQWSIVMMLSSFKPVKLTQSFFFSLLVMHYLVPKFDQIFLVIALKLDNFFNLFLKLAFS